MNIKKTSAALLSMIALCGSQAHAATSTSGIVTPNSPSSSYYNPCGWHSSTDIDVGFVRGKRTSATSRDDLTEGAVLSTYFSAPKLSVGQRVGYSSWFELRLRGSGALSLAGQGALHNPVTNTLWGADAYLFFPVCINQPAKLTLMPVIGWAFNQFDSRTPHRNELTLEITSDYRGRSFAPLAGLYLKMAPSYKLLIQGGLALHFPTFKEKLEYPDSTPPVYTHLKGRRHGLSSEFEIEYAIGEKLSLTSKFEYSSLSASAKGRIAFSDLFNYTFGARFSY